MYRKIKYITFPVDLQLHLFDTLIISILLYSSEVWGFENKYTCNIEKNAFDVAQDVGTTS